MNGSDIITKRSAKRAVDKPSDSCSYNTTKPPPDKFVVGKSHTIRIRVKTDELAKVKSMIASSPMGCSNVSEFTRMLYAREWNRRHWAKKKSSVVADSEWRTDWRRGGMAGWQEALMARQK